MGDRSRVQDHSEELANFITHSLGIILGVFALYNLVALSAAYGDGWKVVSSVIYGASLIILYTNSSLYHIFRSPRIKRVFHILDHVSIYILIAGTYTPFTLVNIRGGWGWTVFGLIWGFALIGIVFKLFVTGKFEVISTVMYLFMGWLILIALKPIFDNIPFAGFLWLLNGGIFYSAGVIFYATDHKIRYGHAIWHLFVLGGSICHFIAIIMYVLPYTRT